MIIKNGSVFIDGKYHNVDVEVTDGKITKVAPNLTGDDVIDASGKMVFPGLIETHIHGADFVSVNDGEECIRKICKILPSYGITSYTPTTTASTLEASVFAVRGVRAAKGAEGADILGINFYSPYRNRDPKVRPDSANHVLPTPEHTLAMLDNDLSDVKIMMIAPELKGGMEWVKWATENGIISMIGFSEGSTRQMYEAADNGATLTDHFFNGFPRMDHHEEGSVIGCLLEDRIYLQMQFDHIHVTEPFIRLAMRLKGAEKIVAVSDSSTYVGAPDGEYMRGETVLVKANGCVRNKATGGLVTGCNSLDENMRVGLRNGYSLEELGTMFSESAAKMLKLTDRGKIEAGRRADIVIMDQGLNVEKTLVEGKVVYQK